MRKLLVLSLLLLICLVPPAIAGPRGPDIRAPAGACYFAGSGSFGGSCRFSSFLICVVDTPSVRSRYTSSQ